MQDCIFCKIIDGEIPSNIVYETDDVIAFRDVDPQAPEHVLIIPKKHYKSVLQVDDDTIYPKLINAAKHVAKILGLDENGFRMVINTGEEGGQTVDHLHIHLLGGRSMQWPPG